MEFNDRATHGASITDLYILAPKLNKVRHCSDPKILEARLQDSPTAFTVLSGSFNAVLTVFHMPDHYNAADVIYMLCFLPLEDPRQLLTLTRSKLRIKCYS
jgi:hypothetical protein